MTGGRARRFARSSAPFEAGVALTLALTTTLTIAFAFTASPARAAQAATTADRQHAVDTFNAANRAYGGGDYAAAIPLYQQVIVALPDQPIAYLYLGNCFDHLSLNQARGTPALTALLKKAEESYRIAADRLLALDQPAAAKNATTALEMLAALYAPDRLHDGAAARATMERLIRLAPADPAYQFSLAKLHENAENYDAAEAALAVALALRPNDAAAYAEVAGHYWDIASHGSHMTPTREHAYLDKGMATVEKALALDAANADAVTYKGQLLREQAAIETDKKKKSLLEKDADSWSAKAKALRGNAAPPQPQ